MDELQKAKHGLRVARVILFLQVVGVLIVLIAQLLEIASFMEHGQDVPGAVWLVITVNLIVVVSAVVAAAFLLTRRWARVLCVVLQCIGLGFMMINVIAGYPLGMIALALSGVVIWQILVSGPVVDRSHWYGDRRPGPPPRRPGRQRR